MKITKQRLKEIIKEELSHMKEGRYIGHEMGPRAGGTPEERLINKLLIRSKIEKAGGDPKRAAEMYGLGNDEEVIAYLAKLMGNPMYDNPNMKEGWGWRDEDGKKPEKKSSEEEEKPLRLSRPKHDPVDISPEGVAARRKLQGKK